MPKYGYKFVFCDYTEKCLALIKLEIPDDAVIVRPLEETESIYHNEDGTTTVITHHKPSTKLRCNKYKFIEVVDFYNFNYNTSSDSCGYILNPLYIWKIFPTEVNLENVYFRSIAYPRRFNYELGENYISELDTNIYNECSEGLHYFETVEDAEKWITEKPNWIVSKYLDFKLIY